MNFKLGVFLSHPIQYYSPWFKYLSKKLTVEVYYAHKQDSTGQSDAGFGVEFEWDTPILEGYNYHWLKNVANNPGLNSFWGCDTPEIIEIIKKGKFDAFLVFGWNYKSAIQAIIACWRNSVSVLIRGDSQLLTKRSMFKKIIKYIPYRILLPRFNHLYVGKGNKEYLTFYGVTESKLFFAPHFVDNDFFKFNSQKARLNELHNKLRESLGIPLDAFVFIYVGKFIDIKKPENLIKAYLNIKSGIKDINIHILYVGSGPMEDKLKHLAKCSRSIHFAGFQNQSKLPEYYASANVLVLPGIETWGLVVNEAMACGLPAIVSDAAGCAADLIDEGQTGFIYPVDDITALSKKLVEVYNIMKFRSKYVLNAVESKIEQYSIKKATEGLQQALIRHQKLSKIRE